MSRDFVASMPVSLTIIFFPGIPSSSVPFPRKKEIKSSSCLTENFGKDPESNFSTHTRSMIRETRTGEVIPIVIRFLSKERAKIKHACINLECQSSPMVRGGRERKDSYLPAFDIRGPRQCNVCLPSVPLDLYLKVRSPIFMCILKLLNLISVQVTIDNFTRDCIPKNVK